MKRFAVVTLLLLALVAVSFAAAQTAKPTRPDIYDRNADVDQRYGHPTRFGLPALVVLDSDGKQLTTQDTGKLEEGDHHFHRNCHS